MKKIKKSPYTALSFIFILFSIATEQLLSQSLLGGTLQFAKNATLNDISIHHCGKKILTQKHAINIPKITYEIPKSNEQSVFYLLIYSTDLIGSVKQFPNQEDEQNTIEYLKINPNTPYLFYKLELAHNDITKADQQVTYHWNISQDSLPETGQIPDTTIIITYFPSFIKDIKGGNQLELPTIYIDNSAIDEFGSEENFEDALIKLQLSSLNLDALHSTTKRKIKSDSRRLLIMDTLT